ncbi:MAG: hypothetical protein FWD76_03965 [Firmicutes bacterium]|nr:hypothetical protein [Bacillota bacterium]
MVRIWAKTIQEEKITRSEIIEIDDNYHSGKFGGFVMTVCDRLDIPTPLVIYSHKFNFTNFNIARFRAEDFVETVDFDMLVLENAIES